MQYVYDGAVILTLALGCFVGYKRGFIATLVGLAKWIIAFALAILFAGTASELIYDNFLAESTEKRVAENIDGYSQIADVYDKTNLIVGQLLGEYGLEVDRETSSGEIAERVAAGESLEHAVCETIVRPAELNFLRPVCFAVIFIIVLVACSIISRVAAVANKLPVVGAVNQGLGIFVGGAYGIIWIFVMCIAITAIIGISHNGLSWLNSEILEKTIIVKRIAGLCSFDFAI